MADDIWRLFAHRRSPILNNIQVRQTAWKPTPQMSYSQNINRWPSSVFWKTKGPDRSIVCGSPRLIGYVAKHVAKQNVTFNFWSLVSARERWKYASGGLLRDPTGERSERR